MTPRFYDPLTAFYGTLTEHVAMRLDAEIMAEAKRQRGCTCTWYVTCAIMARVSTEQREDTAYCQELGIKWP